MIASKKNDKEQLFAKYLKKTHDLCSLGKKLSSPQDIVSSAKIIFPEKDPKNLLGKLREVYVNLSEEIEKERKNVPIRKIGEYSLSEARPMSIETYKQMRFNDYFIESSFEHLSVECPDITIGQTAAQDFKDYYWCQPYHSSSRGFMIFWPHSNRPYDFPFETFNGDWSGETGAWFMGWLEVEPVDFWFDHTDLFAHAGIFQFKLPAPKCDSIVYWGASGRVQTVNWMISAVPGWASTEWWLLEKPNGGGFPSYLDYEYFTDGAFLSDEGNYTISDRETWNRNFKVKSGVESCIYLGVSIMFYGQNGKIESPGIQSYFEFEPGITYIMVPDN